MFVFAFLFFKVEAVSSATFGLRQQLTRKTEVVGLINEM